LGEPILQSRECSKLEVVALYRHPVKGCTPERRDSLEIRADGRVAGDRVLAFRFANAEAHDEEWTTKHSQVALVNTPGLWGLTVSFDDHDLCLRLATNGLNLADESVSEPAGRSTLAEAMSDFVQSLDVNPLFDRPDRLPLKLVGDGRMPMHHDRKAGWVTLHSRASLAALAEAIGDPNLGERRFRSNVVVDGIVPFEELSWIGRRVRIGDAEFVGEAPVVRCLATHANPSTGTRDLDVMGTLVKKFGHENPTFGVILRPVGQSTVKLGDDVEVN
jgi:uncharacterized protein YcbX